MLHSREANAEDSFKWGTRKGFGQTNKDCQFFESFIYNRIEYFLHDCVIFYREGDLETSIGKLVRLFETVNHERKVKVVWFLRPIEIRNFLEDYEPHWNEIFLASGEGKGLFNINLPGAVMGKCKVVCTSQDKRNPPASKEEVEAADYKFCRTFNVGNCRLYEKFPDIIAGSKVEYFFNRKIVPKPSILPPVKMNMTEWPGKSQLSPKLKLDKMVVSADKNEKPNSPVMKESKKPLSRLGEPSDIRLVKRQKLLLEVNSSIHQQSTPPHSFVDKGTLHKAVPQFPSSNIIKTDSPFAEVTRKPDSERSKFFRQLPWEDELKRAQEIGTLVLLENLDPSYTSTEVEDIVWCAFNEKVKAKMIPRTTFCNPHYGKAFVIFKSKVAAESALTWLKEKCLMLTDGRIIFGDRGTLKEPSKVSSFPGHLVIERSRPQRQREEMRNAVSTSHCSQPNTIEFDMALEWRVLQEKTQLWWKALYDQQVKEIQNLKRHLKTNHNS